MIAQQGKPEDLKAVVKAVKEDFGISLVYCWHALHAYWNGVAPTAQDTSQYSSQIIFPVPTAGILSMCALPVLYRLCICMPAVAESLADVGINHYSPSRGQERASTVTSGTTVLQLYTSACSA